MGVVFRNNGLSVLTAGINDSTTTITVANGSVFPNPGADEWFPITVVGVNLPIEIMHCTARSGNTLTVVRGREGTAARPFAVNSRVDHRITAETLAESFAASALHADRAEAAANVAEANNQGPFGGEPWDSTKIYFSKHRCTHIGLSWFANQPNINSEPSTDNPDWSLAGLPEERYMQALLADTWPSGMTFQTRVGQVNSHASAGTGAVIGSTPAVADGNQWASGTFFPRTTTRSWYWVEANINVFRETAGTFVAALFMNDVCIGVGRKVMTAGQFEFPWKVASQGLRQSPTSSPRTLSLRVGNHTGSTGVFHRNGNASGGLYSGLINTVLVVNEQIIQP